MPTAPTLADRHADALKRALFLSRQRQDLQARLSLVDSEMLKTAGQIDLLDALIAEQQAVPHGE
jgi:hypothetical protein